MTIMIATFALVFCRAIQQLNVTGGHYAAAAVTSYAIAAADVSVILLAVQHGWTSIPWMGTGGACGVTTAMLFHSYGVKRYKQFCTAKEDKIK